MNEEPGIGALEDGGQESASVRPTTPVWRIQLFGGPVLRSHTGLEITRFRSSKAAALLCYLALHHEKPCSREALMEALWPEDSDQSALPNRFRVTLASLRKQLEPPGFPFGSVLDNSVANCISLRKGATTCDVVDFETEYALGNLPRAAEIMQAPLLPAVYDDWVVGFQTRYALLEDDLAPYRTHALDSEHSPKSTTETLIAKSNLPSFLTEYVANAQTLSTLSDLIQAHRLVTITGPAGIGKTRLSIEVARAGRMNAVFVPLAHCTADHEFFESIIRALGIGTQNARSAEDQLLEALPAAHSTLIILDNIDHLIEPASRFLSLALTANPHLRCVATSRQALEVPGETTFRLETLAYPAVSDSEVPPSVADLYRFPATALFLKRVTQSRPDFRPQEFQFAPIAEICARLEGLPLAIELAAAQISTLSVPEILSLLSQNLLELKSRQRTLSPKHRSLRAAVASSFEGLEPDLLVFLGQLACFWGGFTREAAKALTENPRSDEHLDELVQRSLINAQIDHRPTRFVFLESVRQFAQEQLTESQYKETVRRHCHIYLQLAAKADASDLSTLEPLDEDASNIDAAFMNPDWTDPLTWEAYIGRLTYSHLRGNYTAGLRMIRASEQHLDQVPSLDLKRDWIVAALQTLPEVELFAEAREQCEQLNALAIQANDPVAEFEYLIHLGLVMSRQNELKEGIRYHQRAFDLSSDLQGTKYIESGLGHLSGSLHSYARTLPIDDPERSAALIQAIRCATELTAIVSPTARRHPIAYLLLAAAEFYKQDFNAAKASFLTALESANNLKIQMVQLYCAFFLSEIAELESDFALADQHWSNFVRLQQQTGITLNGDIWHRRSTRKWAST